VFAFSKQILGKKGVMIPGTWNVRDRRHVIEGIWNSNPGTWNLISEPGI
jgi:general stress protein 26